MVAMVTMVAMVCVGDIMQLLLAGGMGATGHCLLPPTKPKDATVQPHHLQAGRFAVNTGPAGWHTCTAAQAGA
jgi:hypothetical protein